MKKINRLNRVGRGDVGFGKVLFGAAWRGNVGNTNFRFTAWRGLVGQGEVILGKARNTK